MSDQPTPPAGPSRTLARIGMGLAAFAVFTCGWIATRSDDWRKVVGFTVLAGVAALVAQAFSRQAR